MKKSTCEIRDYAVRYRQLLLPIRDGISNAEEYRKTVLQGLDTAWQDVSFNCDQIERYTCRTPAGEAEIMLVSDREDFEHLYHALAYKCEPVPIPASVGAVTISGVINREKINKHRDDYLARGNTDWNAEFKRFTADKSNYTDTIILLSSGPYSAIPAEQLQMTESEWAAKSVIIRMYHELTHFICRKLYPEKKDAIRDEIYADCIGLIAAFGTYDPLLAKTFLGIEAEAYRKDGRLEHYAPECTEGDIHMARQWIREAEERVGGAWLPGRWEDLTEEARDEAVFELVGTIY